MKKLVLIFLMIPLLGVTEGVKELDAEKRPTLEQELQLLKNRLNVLNSRLDIKLAEYNK